MSGMSALDYFRAEKLFAGWNLGNTLDAHINGEGVETGWGNPRANQALMDGVKAAGFDIIRIPVTWMGHIGDGPDYRILENRLRRVSQVVEMANNAGLKVIINLHHDGATSSPSEDSGWLSINKARKSREGYYEVTSQFVRVWKQIAEYFKDYGDWLMFESCNEIHDGNWGHSLFTQMLPQFEILNEWNQYFTDVVRGTGGNNAERYLVIPGYCTSVRHTLADYFKLPNDSAPSKQIVSFHYYDPYEFGIAGTRSRWGTDAEKQQTDKDFAPFKERFIDKNIPVIIGECGAVLQLYPGNQAREDEARESRRGYLSWVFSTAKKYNLVPIYWDNGGITGGGEKFGLFDRRTGQPASDEAAVMISTMINAVK
jgi:endoglucanase